MKRLLLRKLADELECCANVFNREAVFALHIIKRHPVCQAADNDGHWNPSATDDRLTMRNGRVDDDAIWDRHENG